MTTTNTEAAAITITRWMTLSELLAALVEHGAEALLSTTGIEAHADGLLCGHLTIEQHERHLYGAESTWAAWESLRAEHGARLREMADGYRAFVTAENDAKVTLIPA